MELDLAALPELRISHGPYLYHILASSLPPQFGKYDANRLTLAYFAVAGLATLGRGDLIEKIGRRRLAEWVYSMQTGVPPAERPGAVEEGAGAERRAPPPWPAGAGRAPHICGFRGGAFMRCAGGCGCGWGDEEPAPGGAGGLAAAEAPWGHDQGHVAMTYTALALLRLVGDDLSRVRRAAVVRGLAQLQCEDGSFAATLGGGEADTRFVYCAAAVSSMLGDFSGIDVPRAVGFLVRSQGYDGGIGQGPGQEAHGGSTYCGVAALKLLRPECALLGGGAEQLSPRLVEWCADRRSGGFHGRANKPPDCCYSFWLGGALAILAAEPGGGGAAARAVLACDGAAEQCARFALRCQGRRGGFSKHPSGPEEEGGEQTPDPLHTHCGLAGLSLLGHEGLRKIDPLLGFQLSDLEEVSRQVEDS